MIIGLTGGIGSGKSTIAKELAKRGYAIYDCDREAKRIIEENEDVRKAIIGLLGEEAFTPSLIHSSTPPLLHYNTTYVAQRVFAEPELLARLNSIVHPAVIEDIKQRSGLTAKRSNNEAVLFVESAILFEAGIDRLCDQIVFVDAPEEVRLARTLTRDYNGQATPENINKVRARIRVQERARGEKGREARGERREAVEGREAKTIFINNDGNTPIPTLVDTIIKSLKH